MALTSNRSKRKASGGRYIDYRKKRVFEIRRAPILTKLADRRSKIVRGVGGFLKTKLLQAKIISVYDSKNKKHTLEEITNIVENEANRHFVRRNILTKGAVVETAQGKVKITSRPGQVGSLSGVRI
jgi:small subunit ribosomal protein S8e